MGCSRAIFYESEITISLPEAFTISLKSEQRLFLNKFYQHREAHVCFTGCNSVFLKTFQTLARSVKNDGEDNV